MIKEEILQRFPTKRVKAVDGMAVTAEVWEETHDYHRRQNYFHTLLNHGIGIVTGLEVIASDPADTSLYVQPGIAIDSHGRTIVVPQGISYDLAASDGPLHLILTYGESTPRTGSGYNGNEEILYVHTEFGLEARSTLPTRPHVEIARIHRESRSAPIHNAANPEHPVINEIDLRFRRQLGIKVSEVMMIAVSYLGGKEKKHGQGATYLARTLRSLSEQRVWVDEAVDLTAPDLGRYGLLYLVAEKGFDLNKAEQEALRVYLQEGGTILAEPCRQHGSSAPARDFKALFDTLGVELEPLKAPHPLLSEPYLFALPPAGYESKDGELLVGEGVLFSTFDYGCLWQAEQREGPPAREQIRAAMEWGQNLLTYARARHAQRRQGRERLGAGQQEPLLAVP